MECLLLDSSVFKYAMDNLPASVLLTDKQGHIVYVNERALNMYECKHINEMMLDLFSLFALEEEQKCFAEVFQHSTASRKEPGHFVCKHKTVKGRIIDVDLKWQPCDFSSTNLIFVVEDITEKRKMEEDLKRLNKLESTVKKLKKASTKLKKYQQKLLAENSFLKAKEEANEALLSELASTNDHLERLALEDSLTGVYNRRYFTYSLEIELIRAMHLKEPLTLLLIDLDYFKKINDTHGHTIGDEVLKIVATSIQDVVGPKNILCRYGGEEFGVISLGTDLEAGKRLALKIADYLANNPIEVEQHKVTVTVSIGVSSVSPAKWKAPMDAILDYLLKTADSALYKAKSAGRNTVEVYYKRPMV